MRFCRIEADFQDDERDRGPLGSQLQYGRIASKQNHEEVEYPRDRWARALRDPSRPHVGLRPLRSAPPVRLVIPLLDDNHVRSGDRGTRVLGSHRQGGRREKCISASPSGALGSRAKTGSFYQRTTWHRLAQVRCPCSISWILYPTRYCALSS